MKICAIICEFNPFHNGHKYLLEKAKSVSGADKILCVMSGSFTQRGDICIADKHVRARHAVECGADGVIELPAAFAVTPAEIFAKGAIKIISSIPEVSSIVFGCETADKKLFLDAATALVNENSQFKDALKAGLDGGNSYIKSYCNAFESLGFDREFLNRPNNILGLEYVKAILSANAKLDFFPVKRAGEGYSDGDL